jgi:hypothetical protein
MWGHMNKETSKAKEAYSVRPSLCNWFGCGLFGGWFCLTKWAQEGVLVIFTHPSSMTGEYLKLSACPIWSFIWQITSRFHFKRLSTSWNPHSIGQSLLAHTRRMEIMEKSGHLSAIPRTLALFCEPPVAHLQAVHPPCWLRYHCDPACYLLCQLQ